MNRAEAKAEAKSVFVAKDPKVFEDLKAIDPQAESEKESIYMFARRSKGKSKY